MRSKLSTIIAMDVGDGCGMAGTICMRGTFAWDGICELEDVGLATLSGGVLCSAMDFVVFVMVHHPF